MIRAESRPLNFHTEFTNGEHVAQSDTTPDKGGSNLGFRPHELLEAAFASCMNMTVRMAAVSLGIPLSSVTVIVSLNRTNVDRPTFEYQVKFEGAFTSDQREQLMASLDNCSVRNTLSKAIHFEHIGSEDGA